MHLFAIGCTQEPEESDKCHEGTLLHVVKTVSLVDHHCKESVQCVTKQTGMANN